MAKPENSSSGLEQFDSAETVQAIIDAIARYDLVASPWWSDLSELSSNTQLENIEANPDGIFKGPSNTFEAIGTVYVTLMFGGKRDNASMSDSFPVRFIGSFDKATNDVLINEALIDTSSYYE